MQEDLQFQTKLRKQFEQFVNNNILQHINQSMEQQREVS